MENQTERFWMVWNPSRNAPTHRHYSREGAQNEALRLSQCNPDQTFFVLKAVAGFVAPAPVPEPIKLVGWAEPKLEIPF